MKSMYYIQRRRCILYPNTISPKQTAPKFELNFHLFFVWSHTFAVHCFYAICIIIYTHIWPLHSLLYISCPMRCSMHHALLRCESVALFLLHLFMWHLCHVGKLCLGVAILVFSVFFAQNFIFSSGNFLLDQCGLHKKFLKININRKT